MMSQLRDNRPLDGVAPLILSGHKATSLSDFTQLTMPDLMQAFHADYVVIVTIGESGWTSIGELGVRRPLPTPWLADVLDRDEAAAKGGWFAAPLSRPAKGELLLVHSGEGRPIPEGFTRTALALGEGLDALRERLKEQRRIHRLEAVLRVADRWNQTRELEPLLVEIAQAGTQLLHADRASIFLWDRPNHVLVGRPALGVEGGELRIADDAGIVGQVLKTGQPRRVDLAQGQEQINRRIDARTGYQTRTLLCVPLFGRSGERFGVFEMINKQSGNFTPDDQETLEELAAQAATVLENTQEREALLQSRRFMTEQAAQGIRLIGACPQIVALRSMVGRVANTELAVLILGENGAGKEVVSQSIHYMSQRRDHPFIAVNCAAISETLLESELFGHEKGAFTDAHAAQPGKFEQASGGTLFLDEIGDLSPAGQAKLLRVLEEKVVVRVGGSKAIHADARVIAATNQDLLEMVRQKRFRQDLYFRLNVVTMELPALRERGDDILLLAEHFLRDFCRLARRKPPELSPSARQKLLHHNWPGNIRELRNLMERLAYLSSEERIEGDDPALQLMPNVSVGGGPTSEFAADLELAEATERFQSEYINQSIARTGGNMSEAARKLGLHRSNLYRKMRQLGIEGE